MIPSKGAVTAGSLGPFCYRYGPFWKRSKFTKPAHRIDNLLFMTLHPLYLLTCNPNKLKGKRYAISMFTV